MQRFGLPLDSCEGDAKRLRRCLVSGYWRNGARWMADGTFRSVRGNKVGHTGLLALLRTHSLDTPHSPDLGLVHPETPNWMGNFSRDGRDKEDSDSYHH